MAIESSIVMKQLAMVIARIASEQGVLRLYPWNLDVGTYNARILTSEGDLEVLFED